MLKIRARAVALLVLLGALMPGVAAAQTPASSPTICGQPVGPPANLPPANSGPVIYLMSVCFSAQGNVSTVEPQTYLFYIQTRPSQPSMNIWVPYNEQAEDVLR